MYTQNAPVLTCNPKSRNAIRFLTMPILPKISLSVNKISRGLLDGIRVSLYLQEHVSSLIDI